MVERGAYDFYYAEDARRQGIGILVLVSLLMLGLFSILYLLHARFGVSLEGERRCWIVGITSLVCLGFFVYASILVIKGGAWIFAVRDGVLLVRSPTRAVGETFTLAIADIVSITQVQVGVGEDSFVSLWVVLRNGERHRITQNSGLNWVKLFEKLCELNPEIRKEYNTLSDVWNAFFARVCDGKKHDGPK